MQACRFSISKYQPAGHISRVSRLNLLQTFTRCHFFWSSGPPGATSHVVSPSCKAKSRGKRNRGIKRISCGCCCATNILGYWNSPYPAKHQGFFFLQRISPTPPDFWVFYSKNKMEQRGKGEKKRPEVSYKVKNSKQEEIGQEKYLNNNHKFFRLWKCLVMQLWSKTSA